MGVTGTSRDKTYCCTCLVTLNLKHMYACYYACFISTLQLSFETRPPKLEVIPRFPLFTPCSHPSHSHFLSKFPSHFMRFLHSRFLPSSHPVPAPMIPTPTLCVHLLLSITDMFNYFLTHMIIKSYQIHVILLYLHITPYDL